MPSTSKKALVKDPNMLKFGFPYNTLEEAAADDLKLIGSKLEVAKFVLDNFKTLKYRADHNKRQGERDKAAKELVAKVRRGDAAVIATLRSAGIDTDSLL
jgi:hypothetical protein